MILGNHEIDNVLQVSMFKLNLLSVDMSCVVTLFPNFLIFRHSPMERSQALIRKRKEYTSC